MISSRNFGTNKEVFFVPKTLSFYSQRFNNFSVNEGYNKNVLREQLPEVHYYPPQKHTPQKRQSALTARALCLFILKKSPLDFLGCARQMRFRNIRRQWAVYPADFARKGAKAGACRPPFYTTPSVPLSLMVFCSLSVPAAGGRLFLLKF